ncbi:hypothetical protein Golax_014253, partial [Gossypium laxum]|nr:hypothetical protein [Gossypium laxum]
MTVVESMVKMGLGKDKLESSKSKEMGVYEGNHEEDNGNGKDSGGKAVRLGLSAMSAEAKEAENEKKLVKCFLCHGQHRLRKCPKKSAIGLDDGLDKVPKKLGSSARGVESKRSKRSKKKRVKYFWCRCPYELRNCLKQFKLVVVKEKTTSKLVESSKGLPPKEDVILASDLEEEVAMETLKLGPMRLNSRKTTEFAESSARLPQGRGSMRLISVDSSDELPPIGEMSCASDFVKVVMQTEKLTRVNVAYDMYQRVRRFELRGDESRGKSFEGRDNSIV